MFRCLRSATESLRNLGKISVSLGMSYILKIEGIRAENPVTGLFLINWLQIPSRDSWSLSSFIHLQFCCKCTFILCAGSRLQLSTRISPNEDVYKHLYELTSWANHLAWPSGWHKWDCISPLVGVSCTAGPCRPERAPPLILYLMRHSIPQVGNYCVCLLPVYWQPGKPSLWSNTYVVNALHANKLHTMTKWELKPRKKTCNPWNILITSWTYSTSEFKRGVVNGVRMNHLKLVQT